MDFNVTNPAPDRWMDLRRDFGERFRVYAACLSN